MMAWLSKPPKQQLPGHAHAHYPTTQIPPSSAAPTWQCREKQQLGRQRHRHRSKSMSSSVESRHHTCRVRMVTNRAAARHRSVPQDHKAKQCHFTVYVRRFWHAERPPTLGRYIHDTSCQLVVGRVRSQSPLPSLAQRSITHASPAAARSTTRPRDACMRRPPPSLGAESRRRPAGALVPLPLDGTYTYSPTPASDCCGPSRRLLCSCWPSTKSARSC